MLPLGAGDKIVGENERLDYETIEDKEGHHYLGIPRTESSTQNIFA